MVDKKKEEEVADKAANASDTSEESSSEEENLEESEVESKEEVTADYLGDDKEEPEEEVDYKKRYADSTREFQKIKEEKERYTQAIENLERLAKVNPKITAEIEAAQRMGSGVSSDLVRQEIDKAIEPLKGVVKNLQGKEMAAKSKVLMKFEEKHPELFSGNVSKEKKKKIRERIGKVANTLVDTGMTYKQAVERAYFTVNPEAAMQKGRDEAYLEGLGEQQAGFSSQASTQGRRPKKTRYSRKELEVAKKLNPKVYEAMIKEK